MGKYSYVSELSGWQGRKPNRQTEWVHELGSHVSLSHHDIP